LDLFVARYLEWDFGKNKRCGGGGPLQAYCHPNACAHDAPHLSGSGACRFEDVSGRRALPRHRARAWVVFPGGIAMAGPISCGQR
jgi:hypothetical protein